ncbi:hypothetical protein ACWF76_04720 [Streptomyces globisporus]
MAAAGRERRGSAPALSSALPAEGVRTAFGFLAHRMVEKLPPRPEGTAESTPPPSPLPLIACDGPGEEHLFRPHESWVTTCGPAIVSSNAPTGPT